MSYCEYSDKFLASQCVCNYAASEENWETEQFRELTSQMFL